MVVLSLERVPPSLRGELSRWMVEPRAGVFLGNVSAMVRDKIWEQVCADAKAGAALLAYSTNNEQGYGFRIHGDPSRLAEEFDGLMLIRKPK
ncbi:MAG: type I-E CRISPR-associated endoribonuclease Cas2 [Dehalococcoidia bacterium]|nr:type I-E CRISPR-associated endoribonuclease Cas2 [Dehalococcoidia bacterium]